MNCFFPFLFYLMSLCAGDRGTSIKMHPVTPPFYHLEEAHFDFQGQKLYFADQYGKKFCMYDLHSGETTFTFQDQYTGAIVPIEGSTNQFAVGVGPFFGTLEWDGISSESTFTILSSVQTDGCGNQVFNDGKADKYGRLWIGTEGQISLWSLLQKQGNFYHYATDMCNLRKSIDRVTVTNGITWNPSYTKMYFVGCEEYRVDVFDYDLETGEISNQRPFLDYKARNIPGEPHGITLDVDGNLWIASFNGSQIIHVDSKDARILRSIELPVTAVTDLVWGGPYLDVLYVTTSQKGLSQQQRSQQPWAGSVIAIFGLGAKGFPENNAVLCQQGQQADPTECPHCDAQDSCCAGSTVNSRANKVISCCPPYGRAHQQKEYEDSQRHPYW